MHVCVCMSAHTACGVFLATVISSELSVRSKTVKMGCNLGPLFIGCGGTRRRGAWELSETRSLPSLQSSQHREERRAKKTVEK